MKTTLPVIAAFISGFIMIVTFFFGGEIGDARDVVLKWVTIIGGFALVLGAFSIIRVNASVVARKGRDWPFKLATVISVFAMAIPAMMPISREYLTGRIFYSIFPESWATLFGNAPDSIYDWMFNYIQSPMMETMFATLAFYIASAAYRAFRARNAEAALLLITATLVMLWRVPMGEAFLRIFSDSLPDYINMYVMNGFNLSVQRGIMIGAALGAASMSLRIMLGIERTYMGKG